MKINLNYNWKWANVRFEQHDDMGGGSGESNGALDSVNDTGGGDEGGGQQQQQQTAAPAFDVKGLAAELAAGLAPAFKRDESAPKQLTQEEARKALKYYEPPDDWFERFDNITTKKAAMQEFLRGVYDHLYAVTNGVRGELHGQFEQRLSPLQQAIQQRENRDRETRFTSTYPQLAKPTLRPLIAAVAGKLQSTKQYSDEDQFFTDVAQGVAAVMKESNPQFNLETANGGRSNGSSIPVTSSGSGASGGSGSGGRGPAKTGAAANKELFG